MNFLSHYYFDRNATDPNLVMGTILPDLVKNADKRWNLHPARYQAIFEADPPAYQILEGWNRHLEIDRYFHSSGFFLEHTADIRELILPVLENSPVRPSFLAHISLELMLDSLLITSEMIDPDELYAHLRNTDRDGLDRFLLTNNIEERATFFRFLNEFIESAYLHSYREAANILYALNRICLRLWPDPLNETQKLQLTAVLLGYLETLEKDFMQIFREIEQKLQAK